MCQNNLPLHCHRAVLDGAEEALALLPCESPITAAEAREILRIYMFAPEVLRGLCFWIDPRLFRPVGA